MSDIRREVARLLPARRGHFRLESGHHGDLWLDLELLCLDPAAVRPLAVRLAGRIREREPELVCGPLVEGAFVALLVAEHLKLPFVYAEPGRAQAEAGLFPVRYRLPGKLREAVAGRRVALVNDVINAGSAVRGTLDDLHACGASVVVIGTLAVLGSPAEGLAAEEGVPLESLSALPNTIWTEEECPLCAQGLPLKNGGG